MVGGTKQCCNPSVCLSHVVAQQRCILGHGLVTAEHAENSLEDKLCNVDFILSVKQNRKYKSNFTEVQIRFLSVCCQTILFLIFLSDFQGNEVHTTSGVS